MKSVLISIKPKWVEKIVSGEKPIEVRKTAPKEVPFKCFIYMTQGTYKDLGLYRECIYQNRMKVIGEFICDEVEIFSVGSLRSDDIEKLACLSYNEMINYFYKPEELDGKTAKQGFAWHISDLKIYDKPKELSEFRPICKFEGKDAICALFCPNWKYDGGLFFECTRKVTRPPQSWCYVEELCKAQN